MRKKPGHVFPAVADGVHQEACGLTVPLLLIRHIPRTQGRNPGPTRNEAESTPTPISQVSWKTVMHRNHALRPRVASAKY